MKPSVHARKLATEAAAMEARMQALQLAMQQDRAKREAVVAVAAAAASSGGSIWGNGKVHAKRAVQPAAPGRGYSRPSITSSSSSSSRHASTAVLARPAAAAAAAARPAQRRPSSSASSSSLDTKRNSPDVSDTPTKEHPQMALPKQRAPGHQHVHQQQQEQRPRSAQGAAGSQTQAEADAQRPGCFDEAAAAGSFQEALQQWRQATSAAPPRAKVAAVGEPAAAHATASTGTAQPLTQPQADPTANSSVAAFLQRLTSRVSSQPSMPAGAAPAAAAAADGDDSSAMELATSQLDGDAAPSLALAAQDEPADHGDAGDVANSFDALAEWLQHTEATAAALASGNTRPQQLPARVAASSLPAGLVMISAGMMGDSVAAAAAVRRLEELLDGLEQLEGQLGVVPLAMDGCGGLPCHSSAKAAAGAAVRVPDAVFEPGT